MSGSADRNRALIARYEQLRGEALGQGGPPAHGLGLALLLRQGMSAWIRAYSEWVNDSQSSSPSPVRLAAPLPSEVRSQLTLMLASMLACPLRERRL